MHCCNIAIRHGNLLLGFLEASGQSIVGVASGRAQAGQDLAVLASPLVDHYVAVCTQRALNVKIIDEARTVEHPKGAEAKRLAAAPRANFMCGASKQMLRPWLQQRHMTASAQKGRSPWLALCARWTVVIPGRPKFLRPHLGARDAPAAMLIQQAPTCAVTEECPRRGGTLITDCGSRMTRGSSPWSRLGLSRHEAAFDAAADLA